MSKLAIKFIQDYQNGKYGYAVRGEEKALMYACVLKMKTEEQIHSALKVCENQLLSVESHPIKDIRNPCAWVSQKGDIYYVTFGGHLAVAERLFLISEGEFEKSHAKITQTTYSIITALQYVKRPSKLMQQTVSEIFEIKIK